MNHQVYRLVYCGTIEQSAPSLICEVQRLRRQCRESQDQQVVGNATKTIEVIRTEIQRHRLLLEDGLSAGEFGYSMSQIEREIRTCRLIEHECAVAPPTRH